MNCKPGDLAICVSADPEKAHRIGCIVQVKRAMFLGFCQWVIEYRNKEYIARDSALRPIRNPGDGAVDETLLWKPLPLGVPERIRS